MHLPHYLISLILSFQICKNTLISTCCEENELYEMSGATCDTSEVFSEVKFPFPFQHKCYTIKFCRDKDFFLFLIPSNTYLYIHLFLHPFKKHLLKIQYIPGSLLVVGDPVKHSLHSQGAHSHIQETHSFNTI